MQATNEESAGAPGSSRSAQVAVVLLNCRREEEADTLACVRSLRESSHPEIRIILVDNGSPEDVGDRLENSLAGAAVIRTGENLGFTGGNNLGIARALTDGADYVLVLNNDTVVEPDCVSRLVAAAEQDPATGAVGGKILYFDDPSRIWFAGGEFSAVRGVGLHRNEGHHDAAPEGGPVEEVTFLTGCCMLLPARALRDVGAFAEDFFIYGEDVELSLRLRRAGFRLLYDPSARLYHRVPVDSPPIAPHKITLRDRNRRRLVRRHFGVGARVRFGFFFYPSRVVHGVRYLLLRDWDRLHALWRGATTP